MAAGFGGEFALHISAFTFADGLRMVARSMSQVRREWRL